jgi:hypothetical protein
MRTFFAAGLLFTVFSGCALGPPGVAGTPIAVYYDNPILVPMTDHQRVWETVVDVVDDHFPRFEREEPVRLIGDTLTEGRLDTFYQVSPTLLEPWRSDTVGYDQRLENTLQSIRRRAVVRVIPATGGYLVDVAVFKELEDVVRPAHASAGAATLRYDDTLTRVENPVGEQAINDGWIPQGRDTALEQEILGAVQARFGLPLLAR